MTSKKECITMSEQLAERLELEKVPMVGRMEFSFNYATKEVWSESEEEVGHLMKTPAELYELLGLERHNIPFFKEEVAAVQDFSGRLGGLEASVRAEESSLRWHQLVGVVRALERGTKSEPVLLMDTVGLGNTVQVIAIFAMLAYYRQYYKENRRYPGLWGESNRQICVRFR